MNNWCFWVKISGMADGHPINVMEFKFLPSQMTRFECEQELDLHYAEYRNLGLIVEWSAILDSWMEEIRELNAHAFQEAK
jgi:hypothetical protein